MTPTLSLVQVQPQGFLKVAATLHFPELRHITCQDQMPVIQILGAGVIVELEFFDEEGLLDFAQKFHALMDNRHNTRR